MSRAVNKVDPIMLFMVDEGQELAAKAMEELSRRRKVMGTVSGLSKKPGLSKEGHLDLPENMATITACRTNLHDGLQGGNPRQIREALDQFMQANLAALPKESPLRKEFRAFLNAFKVPSEDNFKKNSGCFGPRSFTRC